LASRPDLQTTASAGVVSVWQPIPAAHSAQEHFEPAAGDICPAGTRYAAIRRSFRLMTGSLRATSNW
jgi:hypothetical protein